MDPAPTRDVGTSFPSPISSPTDSPLLPSKNLPSSFPYTPHSGRISPANTPYFTPSSPSAHIEPPGVLTPIHSRYQAKLVNSFPSPLTAQPYNLTLDQSILPDTPMRTLPQDTVASLCFIVLLMILSLLNKGSLSLTR